MNEVRTAPTPETADTHIPEKPTVPDAGTIKFTINGEEFLFDITDPASCERMHELIAAPFKQITEAKEARAAHEELPDEVLEAYKKLASTVEVLRRTIDSGKKNRTSKFRQKFNTFREQAQRVYELLRNTTGEGVEHPINEDVPEQPTAPEESESPKEEVVPKVHITLPNGKEYEFDITSETSRTEMKQFVSGILGAVEKARTKRADSEATEDAYAVLSTLEKELQQLIDTEEPDQLSEFKTKYEKYYKEAEVLIEAAETEVEGTQKTEQTESSEEGLEEHVPTLDTLKVRIESDLQTIESPPDDLTEQVDEIVKKIDSLKERIENQSLTRTEYSELFAEIRQIHRSFAKAVEKHTTTAVARTAETEDGTIVPEIITVQEGELERPEKKNETEGVPKKREGEVIEGEYEVHQDRPQETPTLEQTVETFETALHTETEREKLKTELTELNGRINQALTENRLNEEAAAVLETEGKLPGWSVYQESFSSMMKFLDEYKETDLAGEVLNTRYRLWRELKERGEKLVDTIGELEEADSTGTAEAASQKLDQKKEARTAWKEARGELKEAQAEYETALKKYYNTVQGSVAKKSVRHIQELLGRKAELPPELAKLHTDYTLARTKYAQSIKDAIEKRESERFTYNETVRAATARKVVLEVVQRRKEIEAEIVIPSKTLQLIRTKLRKTRKMRIVGSIVLAGSIGAMTAGVGGFLVAGTLRGVGIGAGMSVGAGVGGATAAAFESDIKKKELNLAETAKATTKNFDTTQFAQLKDAEEALESAERKVHTSKKRQAVAAGVAGAAAGFAVGAKISDSAADTLDTIELQQDANQRWGDTETQQEAAPESTTSPTAEANTPQSNRVTRETTDDFFAAIGVDPNAKPGAAPEVPESTSAADAENTAIQEHTLPEDAEVQSGEEGVDSTPVAETDSSTVGTETAEHPHIYTVQKGDNLWNILEGDADVERINELRLESTYRTLTNSEELLLQKYDNGDFREMSDVLKSIPAGQRNDALTKLFDRLDTDKALQEAVGLKTPPSGWNPSDYIQKGQQVNIAPLEAALKEIIATSTATTQEGGVGGVTGEQLDAEMNDAFEEVAHNEAFEKAEKLAGDPSPPPPPLPTQDTAVPPLDLVAESQVSKPLQYLDGQDDYRPPSTEFLSQEAQNVKVDLINGMPGGADTFAKLQHLTYQDYALFETLNESKQAEMLKGLGVTRAEFDAWNTKIFDIANTFGSYSGMTTEEVFNRSANAIATLPDPTPNAEVSDTNTSETPADRDAIAYTEKEFNAHKEDMITGIQGTDSFFSKLLAPAHANAYDEIKDMTLADIREQYVGAAPTERTAFIKEHRLDEDDLTSWLGNLEEWKKMFAVTEAGETSVTVDDLLNRAVTASLQNAADADQKQVA